MSTPRIQLLAFPGCPNAGPARQVLGKALRSVGLPPQFEDVNVHDPDTPAELQNWASPTILIDGKDVAGGEAQHGTGCRIYAGEDNAPEFELVVTALHAAMGSDDHGSDDHGV